MSMEYVGWAIAILVVIFFPIWHYGEKLFRKRYIECYQELTINGRRQLSREMKVIGEFKKEVFNKAKNMYELIFRDGLKRISFYSPVNIDEYISHWLIKRYWIVYYLLDAYIYEEKLKEDRIKELNFSNAWRLYFLFKVLFSLTFVGILMSSFLFGLIYSAFYNFTFETFIQGALIGISISIINTYLYNHEIIKPEKKKEITKIEYFMVPIESKFELVDIYSVEYEKREEQVTGDQAKKFIWKKYPHEIELDEDDNPLLDNENNAIIKPMIVKGFAKIQDLKLNKNIQKLNFLQIGQEEKMRTVAQMKNDRRSFLARNAYLWKMIISERTNNQRLQFEVRSLHEQLVYIEENKDREIKQLSMKMLLERQNQRNTLKDIIAEIFGAEMINMDWDQVVLKCLRVIEREKQKTKSDQMEKLIELMEKLIEKISKSTGLDIKDLSSLLDISKKEMADVDEI